MAFFCLLTFYACGNIMVIAGWSSSVARWAHNPKVVGSNPAPATNGPLAQLVSLASLNTN